MSLSILRVGKNVLAALALLVVGFFIGRAFSRSLKSELVRPLGPEQATPTPNPYAAYTFDNLARAELSVQPLLLTKVISESESFTAYEGEWEVPNKETKSRLITTSQINIPKGQGPFPVIVMLRGYAEREQYTTGLGTRAAAAQFASAGYITIAPDFLGYAGSSPESSDILIARFSRPLVVLQLLKNLEKPQLQVSPLIRGTELDPPISDPSSLFASPIGFWGHSNGGHIALSVLQVTQKPYPTTLWAPVSQGFPYSVLYYTNELPDGGKYIRQQLSEFELDLQNNPDEFSITSYFDQITAPLQIHQGGKDEAVPAAWSENLLTSLKDATVSAELFFYPAADHNLRPDWDTVVQRDIQFFQRHL